MLASKAFSNIIDQIQTSNLNYQVQLSPFSAYISLKRSLIKEKSGAYRQPPAPETLASRNPSLVAELVDKNLQLEKRLEEMKADHAHAVDNCQKVNIKLVELQSNNIKKEPVDENRYRIAELENHPKDAINENRKYREVIKDHENEINNLRSKVKMKEEISNNLNKHVKELKKRPKKKMLLHRKGTKLKSSLGRKILVRKER